MCVCVHTHAHVCVQQLSSTLSLKHTIGASPSLEKQLKKVFFSPRGKHQNALSVCFIKKTFSFPFASLEAG